MTAVSWELYWPDAPPAQELLGATEDEVRADLDRFRRMLAYGEGLDGALVVAKPGEPQFRAEDVVTAAVLHLCFACVPDVLDDHREHRYRFMTSADDVFVRPDPPSVRLVGETELTEEAAVLLPLLHACGMRFLDLLETAATPDGDALLAHLRPYADRATESLSRHGML